MNKLGTFGINAAGPDDISIEGIESSRSVVSRIDRAARSLSSVNIHAAQVRRLLNERRARAKFFSANLFADPAWDILLELYAAELSQTRIATSNLCIEAEVPQTTLLRWISVLEKEGLVSRRSDPLDGRRIFIELTRKGLVGMKSYVGSNALGYFPGVV